MIASALKLLRDELSDFVLASKRTGDTITTNEIRLENIAMLDKENEVTLNNCLILTLVNSEEESSLKNTSRYARTPDGIRYIEPPVFLNLYILITSVPDLSQKDAYEFALHRLSLVIKLFQSKRCFTIKNSPFTSVTGDGSLTPGEKDSLRLTVELYTLTFEQINHLWGSLGGKQHPFVMYKIRLVEIQGDNSEDVPVIEEIENDLEVVNN